LVKGFKCCDPIFKAERKCPVKNCWLGGLAQVVLAGIVPNWPAYKILQVYEFCFSDVIVKVVVAGRYSVQMAKKLSVKISPIDGGARPITPKTICANGPVVWEVAVCVRVGMRFCTVPVSGRDFRVTIKLSRRLSPGR